MFVRNTILPGADPGFPVGGGADPLGGAPTYDFVKFSEKLHEIKTNLGCRGARAGSAPPPKSATAYCNNHWGFSYFILYSSN